MPLSLLQPLATIPLAFVDTETTGASADFGHRVVELGIVRVENGQRVAEYQQLVDPQRNISAGVTALTGISNAMVKGQPTFEAQLPAAMELLRGAVIIGHNVRFDLSFLAREFRRCGLDMRAALDNAHVLDTVRIARKRFGRGGNGLQRLAPRLGVHPTVAHRALADAQTTYGVFEKMMEAHAGWATTLADAIIAQGGPMSLTPASPREPLLPLELEEALERRKPVLMEYLDGDQNRTQRVIVPTTVRRVGGELMLIAHCHLRAAQRTFKVERIVQLIRINEDQPAVAAPAACETVTPAQAEAIREPDPAAGEGEAPAEPSSPADVGDSISSSSQAAPQSLTEPATRNT